MISLMMYFDVKTNHQGGGHAFMGNSAGIFDIFDRNVLYGIYCRQGGKEAIRSRSCRICDYSGSYLRHFGTGCNVDFVT